MHSNLQLAEDEKKVQIISEALPYIRRFHGKVFVIKYGGASMKNPLLKQKVIDDIALLHYVGIKVVLVHGGGPEINQMLSRLNIPSKFADGLRITDSETMEVVEMILNGKVQRELVNMLNRAGAKAVGLSGKDGNLMTATKVEATVDLGQTGQISSIEPHLLNVLLDQGYVPVISSIACDQDYLSYNINADNVAAQLAQAIDTEKLIYLTDTPGVLRDASDPSSLLTRLSVSQAADLIRTGVVSGGMIPKLQSAIESVCSGVGSVHILNGTFEHVLLLEIFTEYGVGTMLVRDHATHIIPPLPPASTTTTLT